MILLPFVTSLVLLAQGQGLDRADEQCVMYDTCGWNPSAEDGQGGNERHFLNCA